MLRQCPRLHPLYGNSRCYESEEWVEQEPTKANAKDKFSPENLSLAFLAFFNDLMPVPSFSGILILINADLLPLSNLPVRQDIALIQLIICCLLSWSNSKIIAAKVNSVCTLPEPRTHAEFTP